MQAVKTKFKIPNSYRSEFFDYITMPSVIKFLKENNMYKGCSHLARADLLSLVEAFASENEDNENKVLTWLEKVLKEGIKELYMSYADLSSFTTSDIESTKTLLKETYPDCPQDYLGNASPDTTLKLQSYETKDENGILSRIEFYFTIQILDGKVGSNGLAVQYPIFVDLDIPNNMIIGRAKPKSNMHRRIDNDSLVIAEDTTLTTYKLVDSAINEIVDELGINLFGINKNKLIFQKSFYSLVEKYTYTPTVVKNQIKKVKEPITEFIEETFDILNIDPDAKLTLMNNEEDSNFEQAKRDLEIFMEKYIAINYPDISIFTKDREAYPIRIQMFDSDLTKLDEVASLETPLQTTSAFYDNKKTMEYQKKCDTVVLCYNRKSNSYFKTNYKVTLKTFRKYAIIKLTQYVEEEDILNVLSRVKEHSNL